MVTSNTFVKCHVAGLSVTCFTPTASHAYDWEMKNV
jgi:hypothetical protein